MKTNKNGFAPIIAVIVVAAVLLGLGAWYYKSRTDTAAPTPVTPKHVQNQSSTQTGINSSTTINAPATLSTSTSSWKTYRNEKYGFELKYSPDFSTQEIPSTAIDLLTVQFKNSEAYLNFRIYPDNYTETKYIMQSEIEIRNRGEATPIVYSSQIDKTSFKIYDTGIGSYGTEFGDGKYVLIVTASDLDIMKKVLSTFKFINK